VKSRNQFSGNVDTSAGNCESIRVGAIHQKEAEANLRGGHLRDQPVADSLQVSGYSLVFDNVQGKRNMFGENLAEIVLLQLVK
jgi:hypothetical protein